MIPSWFPAQGAVLEQFRKLLHGVPIVLEPRPHPDLVAEGFDPRSLGLFEGLEHPWSLAFLPDGRMLVT